MPNLEDYIERRKQKHEFEEGIKHHIAFGFGSLLFTVILVVVLALIFWIISPSRPDVVAVKHIVELEEFKMVFDQIDSPEVYDMRTSEAYSEGHLPNAQKVVIDDCHEYGIDVCERRRLCDVPGIAFFYSRKGEEYHEIRNALNLNRTSCWTDVYMLDGGFNAWRDAGFEIE